MHRLLVVISGVITAGAVLCGCSVSASVGGGNSVSATKLQDDISSKLEAQGQKPKSVTCRGDLKGEVGATTDCEIVTNTNTFDAHVTATKVDGSTLNYETSPALTKDQLEKQVTDFEAQQNNLELSSISCQSGLDGVEGKTANCTVKVGEDSADIVVTVTKVDGLLMNVDIKEA